jgi:NitT/TauT family transport system ATP-binding protein
MPTEPAPVKDRTGDPGSITVRDVSFAFGSGRPPVLDRVTFDVASGEFFVLLGPSGCGKSTVLNVIAGFEQPTQGTVLAGGRPIEGAARDRVVIFQDSDSLYGWLTVRDNVAFPLRVLGVAGKEREERALTALGVVGLRGHDGKYPSELSGGMKQRTQLARALVLDSPILLMDEPFAALDAQTRSILQDELVQLSVALRRTVLFITHDIGEAILLGDRVGIMRAGPGSSIKEEMTIDLPRPRRRGSAEFGALYERIHHSISEEVQQALRREDSLLS